MITALIIVTLLVATALAVVGVKQIPTYGNRVKYTTAVNEGASQGDALTLDALRSMVLELLDLPADADDATIKSTFDTFGDPDPAATNEAEGAKPNPKWKELCVALGLAETASIEDAHAKTIAACNELVSLRKARTEGLVTAAINDGRITQAQKDGWITALNENFEVKQAELTALKPAVNTTKKIDINAQAARKGEVSADGERITAINEAVDKYRKENPKADHHTAYMAVKKLQPALFQ